LTIVVGLCLDENQGDRSKMTIWSWIFLVVFVVAGIAALVLDRNWVGFLILVGIGLYPLLFKRNV
jgi:hypothetical protein